MAGMGLRWKPFRQLAYVAMLLTIGIQETRSEDWHQFRGQNSSGIGSGSPPVQFGPEENVIWSTKVAPGHSSPCIDGKRLFLTSFNTDNSTVSVDCFDRISGEHLWSTPFQVEALEKGHPSFNPASSSPCCDAENVIAYFGSYGLVCLNHEGKLIWEQLLPTAKSFGGNATSPMLHENQVILYRGNYVDHYIVCFDKKSGKELWKVQQTEKFTGEMACTACPIIHDNKVICHSARSVQAFDIKSGDRLWVAQCATTATSTPVIVGEEVFVSTWNKLGEPDLRPPFPDFETLTQQNDRDASGTINRNEFPKLWIFHRPEGIEAPMNGAPVSFKHCDKNRNGEIQRDEWKRAIEELENFRDGYETHGLLAIPIQSEGHVGADRVRVLTTRGIPEVPSPVANGNTIYLIKNGGQLSCVDVETGETLQRMRTKGGGTHYASPLIANDHLYCFAGDGRVSVIKITDRPTIVSVNEMEENVYATPAIVDSVIYLRTHSKLFAFGEQE